MVTEEPVKPCICPQPNPECRRSGLPMVGRRWELCSGNCSAEAPCTQDISEKYRRMWDARENKLPVCEISPSIVTLTDGINPAPKSLAPIPKDGIGTELKLVLASLGLKSSDCKMGCRELADVMNLRGIKWCQEHREEILAKLREAYDKLKWKEKLKAVGKSITTGLLFQFNWKDPAPGLLDEAIRRAEKKKEGAS